MPYSKVNRKSNIQISTNKWLISLLDSKDGTDGFLGGHALIVVEGVLENNQYFIGEYDITAQVIIANQTYINKLLQNFQGVIDNIRCNPVAGNREHLFKTAKIQTKEQHELIQQIKKVLAKHITTYFDLSTTPCECDSFFEAMSQIFNQIHGYDKHNIKSLRSFCKSYAENSANKWVRQVMESENNYKHYLSNITNTRDEQTQDNCTNVKLASFIQGQIEIEGRMICSLARNILLHIIILSDISEENCAMDEKFITEEGIFPVPPKSYNQANIYQLIVYKNLHLPLIKTFRDYDKTKYRVDSWTVTPEAALKMIRDIEKKSENLEQEKVNAIQEGREINWPYKFQKYGTYSWLGKVVGGNGGDNCVTWAESELAIAGAGNGAISSDLSFAHTSMHTSIFKYLRL